MVINFENKQGRTRVRSVDLVYRTSHAANKLKDKTKPVWYIVC
jgi:hypothetical protein